MIVNQTLVEYYDAYFHPFEKFTEKQRAELRQKLLVDAKMEDDYEKYNHEMEDIDRLINANDQPEVPERRALLLPSEVRRMKLVRQCRSLMALIRDKAASESEREHAAHIVEKYRKELYENTMLVKIDRQIDRMEEQKRRLKVRNCPSTPTTSSPWSASANHFPGENNIRHTQLRSHPQAVLPGRRAGDDAERRPGC